MPIEDFFQPAEVPNNFPLLRVVAARKEAGYVPLFELFRPREALGFRKARIVVHFQKNGQEAEEKDDDWDDNLNAGLIQLGVRSRTPDEEKDRFALGLRAALKTPEKRYGDGYFSAVLVRYVLQTDFRNHREVAPVLEHVNQTPPNESRSYEDCFKMIDAAVKGRAVELTHNLQYDMPLAWDILAGAMARYLDERFSVRNRRLLNLL
jgi:hypothetical protein